FACLGFSRVLGGKRAESQLQLRLVETVLRQIGGDLFSKFCYLLILQGVDQAADFARVCRGILAAADCPVFLFAREDGFAFSRRIDRNPVENVCVDANQMPVPHVVGLSVENLLDFFRQRVNKSARREPDIDLVLFFFSRAANLQHLALLAAGRVRPTGGPVVLSKKRDRSAWLGQP